MRRKKPLLRNEIEMLQMILEEKVFPTKEYKLKVFERLEELKRIWYKVTIKQDKLAGDDLV